MTDYVRSTELFKAVQWTGSNGADLTALMEATNAGENDFDFEVFPGGALSVYRPDLTIVKYTVQPNEFLVAGPYYGTFGASYCEARTVTAARFALEYAEAP